MIIPELGSSRTIKLVVMDYSTDMVHFFDVDVNTNIDEEYLTMLGFHPSSCSWMTSKNIEILHHRGLYK